MKLNMMKNGAEQRVGIVVILMLGLAAGCGRKHEAWSFENSRIAGQLKSFSSEKEAQANAAAMADSKEVLPEFKSMFAAASTGDWPSISNTFHQLRQRAPQYDGNGPKDQRLTGTQWAAAMEIYGSYEEFARGGEKYFVPLGENIINSIPPGSIYFGGTDPGRFVITALVKSQVNGDPFFVATQNALADNGYLAYLRGMYGEKIYIPTEDDSKRCFEEYTADAGERAKTHKLKPGEQVKDANGRTTFSGGVSVMMINALLAKVIFDKNPDCECYVEESFPLDWMYPHLEPHGLIMKVNRQPSAALPEDVIQEDHAYWTKYLAPIIGDWLKDDTSVQDVCAFAEKVYVKHNLWGFKGDPDFAQNQMAEKWMSKLRTSIAGIYLWRLDINGQTPAQYVPHNESDRQRLVREADFALRQAVALDPASPDAVYKYINFLTHEQRTADARLVAETASHLEPHNSQWKTLVKVLKK